MRFGKFQVKMIILGFTVLMLIFLGVFLMIFLQAKDFDDYSYDSLTKVRGKFDYFETKRIYRRKPEYHIYLKGEEESYVIESLTNSMSTIDLDELKAIKNGKKISMYISDDREIVEIYQNSDKKILSLDDYIKGRKNNVTVGYVLMGFLSTISFFGVIYWFNRYRKIKKGN
ncbi:MAG: hypothetical protein RBQ97_04345 [Acholeplasma sp.]|nr:hypothetical protein [Acholeplasma sp.]